MHFPKAFGVAVIWLGSIVAAAPIKPVIERVERTNLLQGPDPVARHNITDFITPAIPPFGPGPIIEQNIDERGRGASYDSTGWTIKRDADAGRGAGYDTSGWPIKRDADAGRGAGYDTTYHTSGWPIKHDAGANAGRGAGYDTSGWPIKRESGWVVAVRSDYKTPSVGMTGEEGDEITT